MECIKSDIDWWWASVLAALFTYIDQTAYISSDWGMAVIILVY